MGTRELIRRFIDENFILRADDGPLRDDVSLIDTGRVDSTGVLTLVAYIEDTFDIAVSDEDLVPAHFDTVDRIVDFIERRRPVLAMVS